MNFDVVVVGAGSAGCAVAGALGADTRRSVCVIEAGPDYGAHGSGRWPAELLDPRQRPRTHDWSYVAEGEGGVVPESRAKVVGGCSSHNQCAIVRPALQDCQSWGWEAGELAEVAREVARQLRLRDVGGIIVCDFIDMESKQSRDRVLQELRTHLGRDRARTKAFSVSELGLIEMTRQRVRQSHLQSMTEPCQTCHGTGRVFTPETIIRRMERSVKRMAVEGRRDHLVIRLHPDVAMYVLEQEPDVIKKLEKSVGFSLEVRDDPLLRPDEFKLVVKGAGRDVTQQYAVA